MKTLAVCICVIITGCGIARQMQEREDAEKADAVFHAASEACNARMKNKEYTRLKIWTECHNEARLQWWQARGFEDADLLNLLHAKRLALAEAFDANKITDTNLKVQSAEIESAFQTQLQHRNNQRRQTEAAITQANAAVRASSPVSCTRIGNTVSCY